MNLYPSGEGLQRVSRNLNIKHNITEDQLCFTGNREGNKKESPHFCLFHPSFLFPVLKNLVPSYCLRLTSSSVFSCNAVSSLSSLYPITSF